MIGNMMRIGYRVTCSHHLTTVWSGGFSVKEPIGSSISERSPYALRFLVIVMQISSAFLPSLYFEQRFYPGRGPSGIPDTPTSGYSMQVLPIRAHRYGTFWNWETIYRPWPCSFPAPLIYSQGNAGTSPIHDRTPFFQNSVPETFPAYSDLPHRPDRRHWLSAWTVCEDNPSVDWQSSHGGAQPFFAVSGTGCFLSDDGKGCAVHAQVSPQTSDNSAGTVRLAGYHLLRTRTGDAWKNPDQSHGQGQLMRRMFHIQTGSMQNIFPLEFGWPLRISKQNVPEFHGAVRCVPFQSLAW